MSELSRRNMLRGAMLGAVSLPIAAQAAPAVKFDLQHWLNTADPVWVADYHAVRLAEAMGRLDPDRAYFAKVCPEKGFALISGETIRGRKKPVAKVFLDDGEPLLAADAYQMKTYPPVT